MMLSLFRVGIILFLVFTCTNLAFANVQDVFVAPTQEQEAEVELFQFESLSKQKQAIALAKSLRCPQCQNQNLVESNSPIAKDLRLLVFEKINQGESEQQVIDYMTARYGEFVRYKPAFSLSNALLWGAPILIFIAFLFISIRRIRSEAS